MLRIFICLVFFASCCYGQSQHVVSAKGALKIALEYGGDKISHVYFTNGDSIAIRSAQGISVMGGVQLKPRNSSKASLLLLGGIKYVTTPGDNGHVRLTRFPIQVLGQFMPQKEIQIRGGWLLHQTIKLKGDGFIDDLKFQNAMGWMVELGYKDFGIAYTLMNYESNAGRNYKANSVGLSFTHIFQRK